MNIITVISAMVFVMTFSGCTAQGFYDGLKAQQEMECRSRPGANPEECSRRSDMSYDEYHRRLKEQQLEK